MHPRGTENRDALEGHLTNGCGCPQLPQFGAEVHRICVLWAAAAGARLWDKDGAGGDRDQFDRARGLAQDLMQNRSEVRAGQGCFELSTGKCRCLGTRCRE